MTINVSSKQVFQTVQGVLLIAIFGLLLWSQPWDNSTSKETRKITVTGDATIEATPDEYTFSPYFESKGTDKTELKGELTDMANEAITKLKELGVQEDDIKLDLSSFDQWYWAKDEEGVATASLQIKVTDKELAQKVQDYFLSTDAKGQSTPQASFSEDKQDELDTEATNKATEDAKRKAELQANQLGAKLGKVLEAKAASDSVFPIAYDSGVATMEASGSESTRSSLPVLVGQNEYTQSITITYELQ